MQSIRNIPFTVFLFIWSNILFSPVAAQTSEPYGQIFSAGSGLSQSEINCILQDSMGFLWVGTHEGLNKYDGYTFQQFRYQPDTISLSSSSIRCLAVGREGVIWVGTDHGVNKLDRLRGDLWTHYLPDPADSIRSRNSIIHSLWIDDRGSVWMRTDRQLVVLDPESEEFTSYNLYYDDSNPPIAGESYSMQMDSKGYMWMGTKDGLQVLNPESGLMRYSIRGNLGLLSDNVRKVFIDRQDRIWCGTDEGLQLFLPDEVTFQKAEDLLSGVRGLNVLSLAQNKNGELLVGTDESLVKINEDLGHAEIFKGFKRPNVYSPFTNVYEIYEDRSEILWLGTRTGLVKIDQKERKFQLINNSVPAWKGLSSNMVSAVFQDINGDLWIGTDDKGVSFFPAGSGRFVNYERGSPVRSRKIANNQIHDILRDRIGNLWLGTGNGVNVMTAGSSRFISFCSGDASTLCKVFDRQHVYDVFEDSQGYIWFASSNGVHRYDPEDRTILSISRIHYNSDLLELKDVYCVTEDHSGRIWIGSSVGLIKHTPLEDRYEVFQAGMINQSANINSNTVFSLHVDKGGDLWVGTASGLNRFHPETNGFEFFRDPVELSELRIYGILEDNEGNLWLSSDQGLSRYEPKLESYIKFESRDGLQNSVFLPGSYYQHTDGRLYFGGVGGLNTFHPDSIPYNPYPPPLSFTQFVRFRDQGGMSKPLTLDRVTTVTLPRGVEIVTIRFSALEFTAPENNRYLYKMVRKGQDGLWIHNQEKNFVTFYKLSPGTYTLSVKGSNNDGLFSEEEIHVEIRVPFPFWNKTLAILAYVLMAGIFVFIVIQFRTRKLRRSNKILRDKEISAKEIAKQREDLARKNKNITDSIMYAKRIQQALLPNNEIFESLLPDSFVLFKPKDIVSGDFYWINQHGNKIYVAAVDCTGHGVPGAFVSIIGFELFRKITASEQGSNPAMILDTLNENFTDMFSDGEQVYLNDGMDLSLCIIDNKEKSLDFSGAFNPLYLVRNETIIEVKADRFSVGADVHFSGERKLFKSHKIYLQKDDVIYLFSDGYADQFGGPEGKKFKYRRFRHLLLTIHRHQMEKQRAILDASIEEWMGDIDQVDDILVIGIKP